MNQVYRDRTVVICVPLSDYNQEIEEEDHVIVRRVARDGLVEITVKELRLDSQGHAWLWPRSTDPQHQAPLAWPTYDGKSRARDIEEVTVLAVVIAGYWQRKPRG